MTFRGWMWAAGLLAALVLQACGCAGRNGDQAPIPRGPAPPYAEVAARYNQRVGRLERLWARTVIGVWYTDQSGQSRHDQLEGHLQYLRPDRLLVTFDKLGNTYAALGSNERRYWWIETRDEKVARVGDHAQVNAERVRQLGLPVYPLDFIELLGITPLPLDPGAGQTAWSPDRRHLMVTVPGRFSGRRLWLDPDAAYVPVRIELLGTGAEVTLSAELAAERRGYQPVTLKSPVPDWSPTVPTELRAEQPGGDLRVRVTLFDPETAGSKPQQRAFDFDHLLRTFGVARVVDLNAPAAAN